jgi:hypothetical protein
MVAARACSRATIITGQIDNVTICIVSIRVLPTYLSHQFAIYCHLGGHGPFDPPLNPPMSPGDRAYNSLHAKSAGLP